MASALRCSGCGVQWPTEPIKEGEITWKFDRCQICGKDCWPMSEGKPISRKEALTLCRYAEFDRRYERREEQRRRKGEPSPDEIGAEEGRAIAEAFRWVRDLPEAAA